jgi:hypothetical protein
MQDDQSSENDAVEAAMLIGEVERDPRISEIFYRLAEFTDTQTGRTMGRKIGVIQEIVCRKLLMQSQKLADSILFEPWLMGASGADHKVEFVFFQPTVAINFNSGEKHHISGLNVTLIRTANDRAAFLINKNGKSVRRTLRIHQPVEAASLLLESDTLVLKLSAVDPNSARLVFLDAQDVRASVESKRVGAQRFSNSDKLGSGIQTIEKAKQASLVAIDADLKFNGTIKALAAPDHVRRYISIIVLGNGVHWTDKDKAIMSTYLDYAFLVRDASIIRYLDYVRDKATAVGQDFKDFLMSYFQGMTKTAPDDFAVTPDDFEIITPAAERRPLNQILEQHIDNYREIV